MVSRAPRRFRDREEPTRRGGLLASRVAALRQPARSAAGSGSLAGRVGAMRGSQAVEFGRSMAGLGTAAGPIGRITGDVFARLAERGIYRDARGNWQIAGMERYDPSIDIRNSAIAAMDPSGAWSRLVAGTEPDLSTGGPALASRVASIPPSVSARGNATATATATEPAVIRETRAERTPPTVTVGGQFPPRQGSLPQAPTTTPSGSVTAPPISPSSTPAQRSALNRSAGSAGLLPPGGQGVAPPSEGQTTPQDILRGKPYNTSIPLAREPATFPKGMTDLGDKNATTPTPSTAILPQGQGVGRTTTPTGAEVDPATYPRTDQQQGWRNPNVDWPDQGLKPGQIPAEGQQVGNTTSHTPAGWPAAIRDANAQLQNRPNPQTAVNGPLAGQGATPATPGPATTPTVAPGAVPGNTTPSRPGQLPPGFGTGTPSFGSGDLSTLGDRIRASMDAPSPVAAETTGLAGLGDRIRASVARATGDIGVSVPGQGVSGLGGMASGIMESVRQQLARNQMEAQLGPAPTPGADPTSPALSGQANYVDPALVAGRLGEPWPATGPSAPAGIAAPAPGGGALGAPQGTIPMDLNIAYGRGGSWDTVNQWDPVVADAAAKHGVPASVLKAIMVVETGGQHIPGVLADGSPAPWGGLMQIHSQWADEAAAAGYDIGTPEGQIYWAAKMLGDEMARNGGDWEAAFRSVYYPMDDPNADSPSGHTQNAYVQDLYTLIPMIDGAAPTAAGPGTGGQAIPGTAGQNPAWNPDGTISDAGLAALGVGPKGAGWFPGSTRPIDHAAGIPMVRDAQGNLVPADTEGATAPVAAPSEGGVASGTTQPVFNTSLEGSLAAQGGVYGSGPIPDFNPQFIVYHITGGEGNAGDIGSAVYAPGGATNYIIDKTGEIFVMVEPGSETPIANGASSPNPEKVALTDFVAAGGDLNAGSISIEVVASQGGELTPEQIAAGQALTAYLSETYGIPMDDQHVIGHSDADPYGRGDWDPYSVYDPSIMIPPAGTTAAAAPVSQAPAAQPAQAANPTHTTYNAGGEPVATWQIVTAQDGNQYAVNEQGYAYQIVTGTDGNAYLINPETGSATPFQGY